MTRSLSQSTLDAPIRAGVVVALLVSAGVVWWRWGWPPPPDPPTRHEIAPCVWFAPMDARLHVDLRCTPADWLICLGTTCETPGTWEARVSTR